MFILGVIVGPAVGLCIGYLVRDSRAVRGWVLAAGTAVLLLAIAILPAGDIGFRLGLAAGIALGVVLYLTPIPAVAGNPILFQPDAPVGSESEATGL
jgi:hypothetical protein